MSTETINRTKPARPFGQLDGQNLLNPNSYNAREMLGDENGGTNLVYVGFSRPGTAQGALAWQIMKLTTSINGNVTAIQWPTNSFGAVSNDYEFSWTLRASYTYV